MNRRYLARLVDKLVSANARVIGIDYLLDRHQKGNDGILTQSLHAAVQNSSNPTRLVLATTRADNGEALNVLPNLASPNWSLQGEIDVLPGYMQLFPLVKSNEEPLFFAGLLAISHQLQQIPKSPQPRLNNQRDFSQQITSYLGNNKDHKTTLPSERSHLQPLTALSYWLNQMWLHPIIDFSIPPHLVHHSIPAWQLLEGEKRVVETNHILSLQKWENQQPVVIIAPGYDEAGVSKDGQDKFNLPLAVAFWRGLENVANNNKVFTGGEYHAYMVHHLLTQRLVIPIPDLWMLGIAILLGKLMYLLRQGKPQHPWRWLILPSTITAVYGLVSLQLYISSMAVLLPWFIPSVTLWIYVLPATLHQKNL